MCDVRQTSFLTKLIYFSSVENQRIRFLKPKSSGILERKQNFLMKSWKLANFSYLYSTLKIPMWCDHVFLKTGSKAMRNWKISVKALTKRLQKLMIITKRLITIIIVNFDNNKRISYNKNRRNITEIGRNNEFYLPVLVLAKPAIKTH